MGYQWDSEENSEQVVKPRRSRWVAGILALLLLCGLLAAGLGTTFYYLRQARQRLAAATAASPSPTAAAPESRAETTVPTPATPGPADTNPPLAPYRLVLVNLDGQVETVNSDGSERRQLTDDPMLYQFPAWSPDGSLIAVIARDRSGGGVRLLTDQEVGQASPRNVYDSPGLFPIYLYWSPDSQQLGILAGLSNSLGLFLADARNGQSSRLLATGQPFYWDWTPDSRQLLIHTGSTGEDGRIAFVNVDGDSGNPNLGLPGLFQAPGISASGDYWAFSEDREDGSSWLVVQNNLGQEEQSVRHAGLVSLNWSPGADQLAFISPDFSGNAPAGPLRLLDVAGGGATTTLSAEPVLAFFWSPDGRYIATFIRRGGDSINAQAPGSLVRVSQPAQQASTELELWLVDVARGSQTLLTSFTPSGPFASQFLPFFDQYALSHRLWSPDSQALAVPMMIDGVSHIAVVPIDGRQPLPVASGVSAFWRQQ